eukprot:scaffold218414_cov30-Tisochrysis_lutea.AAC.4
MASGLRQPAVRAEVSLLLFANLQVPGGMALRAHAVLARRVDVAPRLVPLRLPVVAEATKSVLVARSRACTPELSGNSEVGLGRLALGNGLHHICVQPKQPEAR